MVCREKGTGITHVILEQDHCSWPGRPGRNEAARGEPCWEAVRCGGRCEHRGDGVTQEDAWRALSTPDPGLQYICVPFRSPPHTAWI